MASTGVKSLVDAGLCVVPDEYMRTPKDPRPDVIEYEAEELPVVDLFGIEEDESKRALVVDAVHKACQEWGFFQVTGHGIPLELMQSMNELVHYFFNMPAEERMVHYSLDRTKSFHFGTSFNPAVEKTKLWVDYLLQRWPPEIEEMPDNIPGYREIASEYGKQVYSLAMRLLGLLTECLGLKPGALKHMMNGLSQIRMNYYPPCPNPQVAVGLDKHSDVDTLTILQQENGVEGLEVLHKGRWVTVKPLLGAFVINIGDQIQILTNGKYKSAEHRAYVNSTKTRVSIASFHAPAPDAYIAPASELLGEDAPLYKGCKHEDYMKFFFSNELYGKTVLDTLKI